MLGFYWVFFIRGLTCCSLPLIYIMLLVMVIYKDLATDSLWIIRMNLEIVLFITHALFIDKKLVNVCVWEKQSKLDLPWLRGSRFIKEVNVFIKRTLKKTIVEERNQFPNEKRITSEKIAKQRHENINRHEVHLHRIQAPHNTWNKNMIQNAKLL
jgi:hypothetical protein